MKTFVLKEGDWVNFVQEQIVPFCVENDNLTRSRNKSGMTDVSDKITTSATIFALVGDLGAGKTTFSKTFLHALGVTQHVQSPTFSIINSYDITRSRVEPGMTSGEFKKVFHMDVYRIEDMRELEVLHVDEIFNNPKNIIVIEWADKIKEIIPKNAVWIYFEHDTTETRKVSIDGLANKKIPEQVLDDDGVVWDDNK